MSSDGFDIHELDAYTQKLLDLANDKMPKESRKFLKKNASQLSKVTKKKAKSLGIDEQTGNYYSHFKAGKVYMFRGNLSCRSFNSSPHAHLLEYGHMKVTKDGHEVGFTPGFHIFEKATTEFQNKYYENAEKFVDDLLDKGL
jgi:hypothetical protein